MSKKPAAGKPLLAAISRARPTVRLAGRDHRLAGKGPSPEYVFRRLTGRPPPKD